MGTPPEAEMVMLRTWLAAWAVGVVESVTCTVKFAVVAALGVPLMVLPFKVKPAGKEPEVMDHA